jgi:hypothetical protein
MTSEDVFIFGVWIILGVLAVGLIGWALYAGFSDADKASLLFWRRVKLASALLGIVGLVLLLISFDQLIRESQRVQGREYSVDRFYEAKQLLAHQLAVTCAKDTPEAIEGCKDLQNVDNGFSIDRVRAGDPLSPVTKYQLRPAVKPIAERLDALVVDINRTSPTGVNRSPFQVLDRVQIAFIASVLVIFAIAGAVGEAAYQLRQAKG